MIYAITGTVNITYCRHWLRLISGYAILCDIGHWNTIRWLLRCCCYDADPAAVICRFLSLLIHYAALR